MQKTKSGQSRRKPAGGSLGCISSLHLPHGMRLLSLLPGVQANSVTNDYINDDQITGKLRKSNRKIQATFPISVGAFASPKHGQK
ncbi:MAG: hypothetical protein WA668_07565 [Candidatus Cybelea sp.]